MIDAQTHSYSTPFRPLNREEFDLLYSCSKRKSIPPSDAHQIFSAPSPADVILVSYQSPPDNLIDTITTFCILYYKGQYEILIFIGSSIYPLNSYAREKGEKDAFYRALTQSIATTLPDDKGEKIENG